jgi:uncharacterized protein YodC (DUF2158 family)
MLGYDKPAPMKQFVQTIAGRFGYFIIKRATLDRLTTESAEARERLSLKEQNKVEKADISKLRDKIGLLKAGMPSMAFGVGDCVQLKSGGPDMTVTKVIATPEGEAIVLCDWFDGSTKCYGRWLEGALQLKPLNAGPAGVGQSGV